MEIIFSETLPVRKWVLISTAKEELAACLTEAQSVSTPGSKQCVALCGFYWLGLSKPNCFLGLCYSSLKRQQGKGCLPGLGAAALLSHLVQSLFDNPLGQIQTLLLNLAALISQLAHNHNCSCWLWEEEMSPRQVACPTDCWIPAVTLRPFSHIQECFSSIKSSPLACMSTQKSVPLNAMGPVPR